MQHNFSAYTCTITEIIACTSIKPCMHNEFSVSVLVLQGIYKIHTSKIHTNVNANNTISHVHCGVVIIYPYWYYMCVIIYECKVYHRRRQNNKKIVVHATRIEWRNELLLTRHRVRCTSAWIIFLIPKGHSNSIFRYRMAE